MKKLSKILGLVLVLAMVFSLAVPAGAFWKDVETNFSDAASIASNRKEAVDVVTKLGIVSGVSVPGATQTLIDPDGTLTRAQAAYFIDYVIAGATVIDKLSKPTTAPFSDVPVSHWASQAISYAAERGYIVGDGTGKFNPDKPVTDIEFGILALKAVGYLAAGEQTSTNWKFVGLTEGINRDILDKKLPKDLDTPAKRIDVIQYTFNALKATTVTYSDFTHDYINRQNVFDANSALNKSLGELNFKLTSVPETDDYGVGQHYWKQDNKQITGDYLSDTLLGEFVSSSAVTKNILYTDYQWEDSVRVWVNGYHGEWTNPTNTAPGYWDNTVAKEAFAERGSTANALRFDTGSTTINPDSFTIPTGATVNAVKGAYVRLFDTGTKDGKVDKVVISYEYLGKVKEANSSAGTATIELYGTATANSEGSNPLTYIDVFAENVAKGDYVLVTAKNTGYWPDTYPVPADTDPKFTAIDVVKAETETVKVDSYTRTTGYNTNTLTYGGETYAAASYYHLGQVPATDKDTTIFFDSHKSVIGLFGANSKAGELNYVYASEFNIVTGSNLNGKGEVWVTFTDGTSKKLYLPYRSADSAYRINDTNIFTGNPVGWYSYTLNTDGTINLKSNNSGAGPIVTAEAVGKEYSVSNLTVNTPITNYIVAKTALVDGNSAAGYSAQKRYANASTILNVNGTKYTGYASFPNISQIAKANTGAHILLIRDDASPYQLTHIYIVDKSSKTASAIYGIVTADPNKAAYTTLGVNYNVLSSDGSPLALGVDEKIADPHYELGTIVELIYKTVDGVENVLTVDDAIPNSDLAAGGANGSSILQGGIKTLNGVQAANGAFLESDTNKGKGYIIIGSTQYNISESTLLWYDKDVIKNTTINDILNHAVDYEFLIYDDGSDHNVLALVVTKDIIAANAAAALAAANTWKTNNATILAKTTGTVVLSDASDISTAFTQYGSLTPAAQALVSTQWNLLDSLSAKIAQLDADAIVAALTNAGTTTGGIVITGLTNLDDSTPAFTAKLAITTPATVTFSVPDSLTSKGSIGIGVTASGDNDDKFSAPAAIASIASIDAGHGGVLTLEVTYTSTFQGKTGSASATLAITVAAL